MEDKGAMNAQPVDDAEDSLTITYEIDDRPPQRWWLLTEGAEAVLDEIEAQERRRAFVRKIVGDGPQAHHRRAQAARRDRDRQEAAQ
jgi:hypothetical protein